VLPTSSTEGAAKEQVKSSFFHIAITENTVIIVSFQLMFFGAWAWLVHDLYLGWGSFIHPDGSSEISAEGTENWRT
jgi:hypothetical protein